MNNEYKNTVSVIDREIKYYKSLNKKHTRENIQFVSAGTKQQTAINKDDLLFIRSDNVYIEIYYREDHTVKRELIRNSLKNTENILIKHPELCKCHRSYIVNLNNVVNIENKNQKYLLSFDYTEKKIPISRTYSKDIIQFLELQKEKEETV